MSLENFPETAPAPQAANRRLGEGCVTALQRNAVLMLVILLVGGALFSLSRNAVYKIRPYERGLHLRGGRFINVDEPGWHFKIPFVDTVIGVTVNERGRTIDKLAVMTSDDVTMDISLLYTYRVDDPVRFQLEVFNPDEIVSGFVQGTLRDVVNIHKMDEVMHSRQQINLEVFETLEAKQEQYGVRFILVQIQSASPPSEVVDAIKDRMVAVQLQEQAVAEAIQAKTLADSRFYTAQKEAEGEAYQITKLAEAQKDSLQLILQELETKGALGEAYLQVLIAQALNQNSKWIISNGGTLPVIDLRQPVPEVQPTAPVGSAP
jgi:regulator of protease activity HflC (stomatin/prohibitin superfamily)